MFDKCILTIDDEESIRFSFKSFLEDNDYRVLEATNGEEGIILFNAEKPDLVLVDLKMPKVSGVQVLKHIKLVSPETPVIVVSGTGIIEETINALHEGADDYMLKPISDLNILLHSIERSLERVELVRMNQHYQEELEALVKDRTEQLELVVKNLEKKNIQLAKEEKNLAVTFNSMGDAAFVIDNNFDIQRTNPAFLEMVTINDVDIIGCKMEDLFVLYDYKTEESVRNPIFNVFQTRKKYQSPEKLIIENKFHSRKIVTISSSPIILEDNKISGVITILKDITARVNLEEDINQVQKMDAIGQLAGGVAHDFNNVLGGIIGSAEILAMKLEGHDNLLKLINIIKDAGKRAGDLTSKLLEFSRKQKVVKETFNVHKSVYSAVGILERSIDPIIKIHVKLKAKSTKIIGDPSQLENAIINLGVNARDVLPEGGEIHISSKNIHFDEEYCRKSKFQISPGEYIQISVQDNGCGISEEIKEKIFEPFFTTKDIGKGTGLGLASVYATIVRHSGFISLESELNIGTAFNLFFPISESLLAETKQLVSLDFNYKNMHVLVVDDEDIIRTTCSSILENYGMQVDSAENGLFAIELCKVKKYDIIFLDMLMPELSGEKTYYKIKELLPDAIVIIISGFSEDNKVEKLLEAGVKDFLPKPFNAFELIEVLNKNFKDKK